MPTLMRELARRINGSDKVAAARAAADARLRFERGETEGCRYWQEWVHKNLRLEISAVRKLISIGKADDPELALVEKRQRHNEIKRRSVLKRNMTKPRERYSHADLDKTRQRLNLPPRVDSRSYANTDHVDREFTNILTAWNSSQEAARARFLAFIGVNLQLVDVA
jgi:hypothetical protein